jgi:ATP-dependent Lon protease
VSAAPEIPLFPLRTVLFPGGLLPLRIFEARYVDMVGRCMRHGEIFGVVLLENGAETAGPVATASIGTTARIVDFQALPDGLLGLLCRGERRFRIIERRVRSDRLRCARSSGAQGRWQGSSSRGTGMPTGWDSALPSCCRSNPRSSSGCSNSRIRTSACACSPL